MTMRSRLLYCLAAFSSLSPLAKAELKWDQLSLELTAPTVEKPAVGEFRFTNAGDNAVTITSLKTSCSCTTVELAGAKKIYQPHESGVLTVRVEVTPESLKHEKSILVGTDDQKNATPLAVKWAAADPASTTPATQPSVDANLKPSEAVQQLLIAMEGKTKVVQGTWSIELRRGDQPPIEWAFAVKQGTWSLASKSKDAATSAIYYSDGQWIYDLQSKERFGMAGESRLPIDGTLWQFITANAQPRLFLAQLGQPTAISDEIINGTRQLRVRFEAAQQAATTGPIIVGAVRRTTDVYFNPAQGTISALRFLSLDMGEGTEVRAENGNLSQVGPLPQSLSRTTVTDDDTGNFTPEAKPYVIADMKSVATDAKSVDEAVGEMAATAYFSTPRDMLDVSKFYRERVVGKGSVLSDEVALVEATFAARDIGAGLQQWDMLDTKLASVDRNRLIGTLSPIAAEAAWFSAHDKDKVAANMAAIRKIRTVANDEQWSFVAPQILFGWKELRTQQLSDVDRQELDEMVLARLCRCGNVSVLIDLLRLARTDPTVGPLITTKLNSAAAAPLPAGGYVGSTLSALAAAAVSSGDLAKAKSWVAAPNWNPATPGTTRTVLDQVGRAVDRGLSPDSSPTPDSLLADIAIYHQLGADPLTRDAGAQALQRYLVSRAAQRVAPVPGVGQPVVDPIEATGEAAGSKEFWNAVIVTMTRHTPGSHVIGGDVPVLLAKAYSLTFKNPEYLTRTLVTLARSERVDPALRAASIQHLNDAMTAAPNDNVRIAVAKEFVQTYSELGEPTRAKMQILATSRLVSDPKLLTTLASLSAQIDRREIRERRSEQVKQRQVATIEEGGLLDFLRLQVAAGSKSPLDEGAITKFLKNANDRSSTLK